MDLTTIISTDDLSALLESWGLPVVTPPEYAKHWWRFEWRGNPPSVFAFLQGSHDFFILPRARALELYVMDERDCWFNLVGYLPDTLPESEAADTLRMILHDDWSALMYRCRRLRFEFEWMAGVAKSPEGGAVDPDLKERLFDFSEALVGEPNMPALTAAVAVILELLTRASAGQLASYLLVYQLISPGKYRQFVLPERWKQTLDDIGAVLHEVASTNQVTEHHWRMLANLQNNRPS